MQKIDLSKTFIGIDKKVINAEITYAVAERIEGKLQVVQTEKGVLFLTENKEPLTLRNVCEEALLIDGKDEKITADEKIKRSKLGMKILLSEVNEIEMEAEEIVMLKKLIFEKQPTLIAGQCANHLENK